MKIVAALVVLVACGDNKASTPDASVHDAHVASDAAEALEFQNGPTFSLPVATAPLTGRIRLKTNRPTKVSLQVASADRIYTIDAPEIATVHDVPVMELRVDTVHHIVVTASDEGGATVVSGPIEAVTPTLPAFTPAFTTTKILPAQIEPGITLAAMQSWVLAVDVDGKIIWFVDLQRPVVDVTLLPSGRFLVLFDDRVGAAEIDAYGTIVKSWQASNRSVVPTGVVPVAVDTFHHELAYLPGGDLLTLSTERRELANYPTSETDPTPRTTPAGVIGDVVTVFKPDGTVRATHSMLDALDPRRVGYGSFGLFWSVFYEPPSGSLDWSHGNAVVPTSDNGFLVSLRHQDALVKLDASGDVQWILGTHDNWSAAFAPLLLTPVGAPFAFPFHQHAPMVLSNGNILVFDNGNFRVSPPATQTQPNFSRAVEFSVDPVAKEVRQTWEYSPSTPIFAAATGDVDIGAQTGNVIVTFGTAAKVVEVTHTSPAMEVFRLESNFNFYRSERVHSLYP